MSLTWNQLMKTKSRDDLISLCKHKREMAELHYNYVNRWCLDDVDYVYQRETAWDRYNLWHYRLRDMEDLKKMEEKEE